MSRTDWIAWDIGGAHLKVVALDRGGVLNFAQRLATPLWRGCAVLEEALADVCQRINGKKASHVITLTAELADIFTDRAAGIRQINAILSRCLGRRGYYLYAGRSGFVNGDEAGRYAADIASANWHATASFVAQNVDRGVLIDIGSTTTDLVPFMAGVLHNTAYTDHERLCASELVYTGIVRTPVMAVVKRMFYDGKWQNIAAEHFATMADVYRLIGVLDERDDIDATADEAGKTPRASARRLLRMVGLDYRAQGDTRAARRMAYRIAVAQFTQINEALKCILMRLGGQGAAIRLISSGASTGHFLSRKLALKNHLEHRCFTEFAGELRVDRGDVLRCATAVAVARIARAEIDS